MRSLRLRLTGLLAIFVAMVCSAGADEPGRHAPEFEVSYDRDLNSGPISARVYVMLTPAKILKGQPAEPRLGPNWFRPQPFFAVEAKDWKPGEKLRIGASAVGFPGPLDKLEPGDYLAQAVVRLNLDTHKLGDGEGNLYGPTKPTPFTVDASGKSGAAIALRVDAKVAPAAFHETELIKYVEIESEILSAFHHRPIKHRAAVILPEGEGSKDNLPAIYIIPGFGGDHTSAARMVKSPFFGFGKKMVRVILDPDCGTGHHVFADSAFNGPRGKALVEELIPHIEKTFHTRAEPRDRLLNGHSSGGWSSLWLQTTYPDIFGGTWSTSPDPVDFRNFQVINLYAPGENMFKDAEGKRRPVARMENRAVLFYDNFSKMEDVIGDGGQLHSFEAVFSPLDPAGRPRLLWNRSTGTVDHEVAKAWEAYDIRLVLERNWKTLGPKLKGKLHVITGDLDTFYLEGAVKLLKASLHELGSDAVIEVVPGRDHSTVLERALSERFDREMNEAVSR